ncbi:MAG: matrixin family metalloprotease [Polyangiaceae bacterium]
MTANRLALAAAAAVAILAATPAASAWVPIDGSMPVWEIPVNYYVNEGSIPNSISGIGVARIDEGFAEWASPGCTFFEAVNAGDTNEGSDYQDGVNVLRWQSGNWPNQLGDVNSVIGVTSPVFDNGGGMYDADIVFNNVGFCWNDSGGNGCVDTGSIATHEEGHFLGLGHTNGDSATMVPFYLGGTAQRSIEQDDEDGVCALYPAGGQQSSSGNPGSCDACTDDSVGAACNGAYQACGQSQACVDFSNCIQGCQAQACIDQCAAANPGGAQTYVDLIDCLCADCAVECATECGGSSSSSSSSAEAASAAASTAASAGVGGGGVGPAGNAGVGGTTGTGDDGSNDADTNLELDNDSGCGCRTVGGGGSSLPLIGLAAGAAALVLARRRRRR